MPADDDFESEGRFSTFRTFWDEQNAGMEDEFKHRYWGIIQLGITGLQKLTHLTLFISLKLPLMILYALTLSPLVLIEKLSMFLLAEDEFEEQASFSDVGELLEKKINRPIIDYDALTSLSIELGGKRITDDIFAHLLKLLKTGFQWPPTESRFSNMGLLLAKFFLGIYAIIAVPTAFILMCLHQFVVEKAIDYVLPFIGQVLVRTVFNMVCSIPILAYDGCRIGLDKARRFFCEAKEDSGYTGATSYKKTQHSLVGTSTSQSPPSPASLTPEPSCCSWWRKESSTQEMAGSRLEP